ncbi:O-antigen ligase family protein [Ruegeria atlantica]|uniref:Lipid A core-O-antigen ligase n=1 Tax=Ruegeria atlantica TaxID=81569 RepID=A0A0P1EGT8_9RHOB|nr:O-antigen ligase family protein [Ruegeria atlantica]CUH49077.1 Lipid A core-O-antigen ligase [Ruegeria atlantica]
MKQGISGRRAPDPMTVERAPKSLRKTERLPAIVTIFLLGLTIPFILFLGPLRLSVYRLLLVVLFGPLVFMWLSGRAGRIRLPDIALLLMCVWIALSYAMIHGPSRAIEAGGIGLVETMGAYLIARIYVRTPTTFYTVVRVLFWVAMALLPLAVIETISGRSVALDIFEIFYKSYNTLYMDPRWGLRRVQSVFEHPILYGAFSSVIIGLGYFVLGYGKPVFRRIIYAFAGLLGVFLSLSSGPFVAAGAQMFLIAWDQVFKSIRERWVILSGLFLMGIVVIELFANRSVAQILISYVAFRKSSAWNRLRIWEHGTASVAKNPLFGVGQNEWERPAFMPASIDMFWLLPAVRFGLPSAVFMQLAFVSIFLLVLFRKNLGPRESEYRTGYLITLLGLYIAGWTVHYWNAVYVLFVFLLGCGFCFFNEDKKMDKNPGAQDAGPNDHKGAASDRDASERGRDVTVQSGYTRQKKRHFRDKT